MDDTYNAKRTTGTRGDIGEVLCTLARSEDGRWWVTETCAGKPQLTMPFWDKAKAITFARALAGIPIHRPTQQTSPPPEPEPAQTPPKPSHHVRFCDYCGRMLNRGGKFCDAVCKLSFYRPGPLYGKPKPER